MNIWKKKIREKKGFTLVELVVVIAILAILAAIAVPAVIGIIHSADESQLQHNAETIDQACKTYYMGIKSGTINSNTFTPRLSNDIIPDKDTGGRAKIIMAKSCTIAGALEYNGLTELIGRLEDYGYDEIGTIKYYGDPPEEGLTQLSADGTETFSDINYAH